MALDDKHSDLIYGCSWLAALVGFLFGWIPGSDLFFLLLIWIIGSIVIVSTSPSCSVAGFATKLVLAVIAAGFTLGIGIEIVSLVSLPVFWIVNPVLDFFATYRVLRAFSKLFARKDPEEITSSISGLLFTILKLVFGGGDDSGTSGAT